MKIGISAFAWTAKFDSSHLALLPTIKQTGLGGVEIPMFDPSALPIGRIREALHANRLECTVCAILPKSFNPISSNPDTRRQANRTLNSLC